MAISYRSTAYEGGALKKAELENLQPREILREGRTVGIDRFNDRLRNALLKDRFVILRNGEKIAEQSFRMNEFISGSKLATAENAIGDDELDRLQDRGGQYSIVNKKFYQQPDQPEQPDQPDKPSDGSDESDGVNPIIIYGSVALLAYVISR